jgi:hypothetical protein
MWPERNLFNLNIAVLKYLFLLLLLTSGCFTLRGQTNGPVRSDDYAELVRQQAAQRTGDTVFRLNPVGKSPLRVLNEDGWYIGTVKAVRYTDSSLYVQPLVRQQLRIGATYTATWEQRYLNRQPALQQTYAQGRNNTWRGAETGELFSYGPLLSALSYDGSFYEFDEKGRLSATGSGPAAKPYQNNILRNPTVLSQVFNVDLAYTRNGDKTIWGGMKIARTDEETPVSNNDNTLRSLDLMLGAGFRGWKLLSKLLRQEDDFSNSNRTGFLNRAYQYGLLTPASFENAQGTTLQSGAQRSYSPQADNPIFLLHHYGHFYHREQTNGGLEAQKSWDGFRLSLIQALEKVNEIAEEGYRAGTAGFPDRAPLLRAQDDRSYYLKLDAAKESIELLGGGVDLGLRIRYTLTDNESVINYLQGDAWKYGRSTHEVQTSTELKRHFYGSGDVILEMSNTGYASNTAASGNLWLPSAKLLLNNLRLGPGNLYLSGGYTSSISEKPISRSLSYIALTALDPSQLNSYQPMKEVAGFRGLRPTESHSWEGGLRWSLSNWWLNLQSYTRQLKHDVFPVLENNEVVLKDLAAHRENGFEAVVAYNRLFGQYSYIDDKRWHLSGQLSFNKTVSKVTNVGNGYDYTPLAGFRSINRALVKGAPLGAIVGSSYRRDANEQVIIGADGFPLVDHTPKVIGNPIPDFVMKHSLGVSWRRFQFNLDLQYQRGGQVWNGTQAALDYYGRSAVSAQWRNTRDYIFKGVKEDGHVNDIPVAFNDPAAPLDQNRWVRYGVTGVAEQYIQDADHIRVNNVSLGYERKVFRSTGFKITAYARNLLLWTAYDGNDPQQELMGIKGGNGLDFFNLPSTKNFGVTCSITL